MSIKEKLKNKYSILVIIDIAMMIILILNLTLIIFDLTFSVSFVSQLFKEHFPGFYNLYNDYVHVNFHAIDLVFVIIFLSEFFFSWTLAVIQKVYHKWFFYPFLHWYDLIGCIPVGSLRFVRILRVYSILIRLHNLKIIDLTNTYFYIKFKKYYGIIVEEVSDRVVVKILEGVQDEIYDGGPVMDNIINDVIRPKQDLIVEWVSRRLGNALERDVLTRKEEIGSYVENLISDSLRKNKELKTIQQIPVMGNLIAETIEKTISDIINNIIEKSLNDLASYKNRALVKDATDIIINTIEHKDEEAELSEIFTSVLVEVIEIMKKQVQIQKWKLKERAESDDEITEKEAVEFLLSDNIVNNE